MQGIFRLLFLQRNDFFVTLRLVRTNWGKSAEICPFGAGSGYLLYPTIT